MRLSSVRQRVSCAKAWQIPEVVLLLVLHVQAVALDVGKPPRCRRAPCRPGRRRLLRSPTERPGLHRGHPLPRWRPSPRREAPRRGSPPARACCTPLQTAPPRRGGGKGGGRPSLGAHAATTVLAGASRRTCRQPDSGRNIQPAHAGPPHRLRDHVPGERAARERPRWMAGTCPHGVPLPAHRGQRRSGARGHGPGHGRHRLFPRAPRADVREGHAPPAGARADGARAD